jgi:membrane-associated phospholipid phosphatase
VVAFFALLALAFHVKPAGWLDSDALSGFVALGRPSINGIASGLAHLCNPFPYALAAVAVIAVAAAVKGPRTSAAVGLLLVGANVSSQVLKPLLSHHRELYYTQWHLNNINDASFPSGHATAAMALSLAVLMIVPRAYRPITAAIGTIFTIGVTFSILMLSWHYPSDVVAGFLVATAWGLVSIAALRYAGERWPHEGEVRAAAREAIAPRATGAVALCFLLAGVAGCLVAASRADQIARFADRHTAFVAVAGAIAVAAALLLAAVVALSGQRSTRSSR